MGDQFGDFTGRPIEDTCPECGRQEADQLLEDEKIVRYMCPSCGHEWQPYSTVEFGYVVRRIEGTEPIVSEDDLAEVGEMLRDRFEMLIFNTLMGSRSFENKEDKDG